MILFRGTIVGISTSANKLSSSTKPSSLWEPCSVQPITFSFLCKVTVLANIRPKFSKITSMVALVVKRETCFQAAVKKWTSFLCNFYLGRKVTRIENFNFTVLQLILNYADPTKFRILVRIIWWPIYRWGYSGSVSLANDSRMI